MVESTDDVTQHQRIDLEGVRIDRGHMAASAQGMELDNCLADAQFAAGPFAFGQSLDALDDDVRSQPPDIAAEGLNRAVSRNQQRENVETIDVAPCLEPGVLTSGRLDQFERRRAIPRVTINRCPALTIERGTESEQPIVAPRRSDPFGASYADDAVARNAVTADFGCGYLFAGERLHGVAPELSDPKAHVIGMPIIVGA